MECLHGLLVSSTMTQKGSYILVFVVKNRVVSCFAPVKAALCLEKLCYSFVKVSYAHPRCFGHGLSATMPMVNDTNNQNYAGTSCVRSERDTKKLKIEGSNQGRLFYCYPHAKDRAYVFLAWKPEEDPLEQGFLCGCMVVLHLTDIL